MFKILFVFLLHVIFEHGIVKCRTLYLEVNYPTMEEVSFMTKYGYLPESNDDIDFGYTAQSISEAVKKLQEFAGIPRTGMLDVETRKLFKRRRCGVKDIDSNHNTRKRRYIAQQGWNKRSITYRVLNEAKTLEKSRIETQFEAGLAVWAPHGGLQFLKQENGQADIQVSFARANHGDGFPFDGPGRVVAHAFPPPHGAMHFDDDEVWTDDPDDEDDDVTDFFAVAVHEIGHALGLSHSNVKASVMYPYYQVPVEKLHIDDILGMQELYAKNLQQQETEVIDATENALAPDSTLVPGFTKADSAELDDDIPDLCMTNYDTIQVIQGKIYVFEEEWVWVLTDKKQIESGYPKRFHDLFVGLPNDVKTIKTIYEKNNGNIVVFSGRNYWEFNSDFQYINEGELTDYSIPRQIKEMTTVFMSNYNNKTYLIEYNRFWRYDELTGRMDVGYPKSMGAWRQVPYPVDAAIIWQEDTYFFRGPRFWRFDNTLVKAHEYYPLPTAQVWFPCAFTPDTKKYFSNIGP